MEVICTKCNNKFDRKPRCVTANIRKNGCFICHKCACIAAGKEGRFSGSKETRSKVGKKRWQNQEYKEKIRAASTKAWQDTEKRSKASQLTKKLWEDNEYRSRISKSITEYYEDDNNRAKTGEAVKKAYENDETYRLKIIQAIANNTKISLLQVTLYNYLDDLNVKYHKEGVDTIIGHYIFDCLVPIQGDMTKALLIECQGDYWYSLDRAIRNDKSKFTYINKYFPEYEIMYIWEHEFFTKDRVLDRIKLKIGLDIETLDFSFNDIQIRKVAFNKVSKFLETYHYIGSRRGGTCFAVYLSNKLIACIVYSSFIRDTQSKRFGDRAIELSRLCIHPSYHKKNFGSWLISRTIKMIDYDIIVSYCDKTVGHTGSVYLASNFKLDHVVPANYWYVDRSGYVMHKKTLYIKSSQMSMTEAEYAEKYGYQRKYGGEKLCFIYKK